MTPLFNKDTDLVGWLSEDKKNIFDTAMNWVAFVASDSSVWNVNKKNWCGHLYGNNIRDYTGKTLFWNPDTPISNTSPPYRPYTPFTPFIPFRPFQPFTPVGGWSSLT
ncbi:4-fold beta flower protein [Chryseobacterium sp. R2ACT005]|uniref:4-fold beta flower protein n=1 Tax=Chryseobacterium sp. R2ACT005 TaxID=3416668 RepID=UPI003CEEEF74